jgi:capsular exopolysaccharide synthesis family protein
LIAGLLSILVGIGLAFLKAALYNTIRTATDVEDKLNQVVVGVLPLMKSVLKKKDHAYRSFLDKGEANFSEAVRTIRTGVVLSGVDKPLKTLVVTSSIPGEGKTTVSMCLAMAFSQMEKVILIDADMRRPSVATNFNLPKGSYGLSEIIAETAELKECIHTIEGTGSRDGLKGEVIPAGITPPNPLELLSSKRFKLERLAENYDRVIIDSAPTQAVSDSMVLSALADGVLYVVKSDATSTQIARDGINRLIQARGNVIGVVLNHFDPESAARHGYYSKGYYDYYGYGSKKSYS